MKQTILTLAGALTSVALLSFPTVAKSQSISNAELSATTCFQCHGAEGRSSGGSIPPLAGYPEKIMVQQLIDMKSGKRPTTVMGRHAKGYTDDEIRAIAKYLATLKP